MKKAVLILLSMILISVFASCNATEYTKGLSAMKAQDYEGAREVFMRIPDYKDALDKANECRYSEAQAAYTAGSYEAAKALFLTVPDYRDSKPLAEACSLKICMAIAEEARMSITAAIKDKDDSAIYEAVRSYTASDDAHAEIIDETNAFLLKSLKALLSANDYDSYVWFDRVLTRFEQAGACETSLTAMLTDLRDATAQDRIIAFLNGKWVRLDDSLSSGLEIEVIYNADHQMGVVLKDLAFVHPKSRRAEFHWDRGMLIWKDIAIGDANTITMDCIWLTSYYNLGVQSTRYSPGIGRLSFDNMLILTQQSTGEETCEWDPQGDSNVYVKQTAVTTAPPLTAEDFSVTLDEPVGETFEAGRHELSDWFSSKNKAFYVYDAANTASTARNISIGSAWDDVNTAYGHGRMNLFQGENDAFFKYLKRIKAKTPDASADLATLFLEHAEEYTEYKWEEMTLRFYFADGNVIWILWTGPAF